MWRGIFFDGKLVKIYLFTLFAYLSRRALVPTRQENCRISIKNWPLESSWSDGSLVEFWETILPRSNYVPTVFPTDDKGSTAILKEAREAWLMLATVR